MTSSWLSNVGSNAVPEKLRHLIPVLPSAEWFAQAWHDVHCPIEEVGLPFETWKDRHPGKTIADVVKERKWGRTAENGDSDSR